MPDVPSREEFVALQNEVNNLRQEISLLKLRPNYKNWLKPKEALEFLNIKDNATLISKRNQGLIEYRKTGKKVDYYLPSLEAYIDKLHIKPEIKQDRLKRISE
ncbi:hypothetical protein [Adhaeribacter radiodurans]|uniref:Helix-turn-helix domain-containing protein n=1 Tax=Adhaeribacter radiodurans TaxID=2745197 RepID=A0A7L7LBE5_9BACT|nr:hypothetical protein [Adhaeribacter radiodurans]QMU30156.1 hypothetical protein HUW48_19920 [Adhaeribacter radiodurans]